MKDFKLFYGLEFNPFEKGQKEIPVNTADLNETLGRLNYLKEIRGIGLLTGQSGTGKTFIIKRFCESLNSGLYKTVYMPMSTLTTIEFYRALCEEFGLEPKHKKIDNFRNIQEYIKKTVKEKRIIPVIVLDEAQFLKTDILNDLIMLLNFNYDSENYAVLILAGTPRLLSTINKSIHEALKQRIVIRYNIAGMDEKDTKKYIIEKLSGAGRIGPLFTENALTALSNACQGSARKLNNLITHAMIIGTAREKITIDTEIIMEAANEIG